jgi:hypothetical protein
MEVGQEEVGQLPEPGRWEQEGLLLAEEPPIKLAVVVVRSPFKAAVVAALAQQAMVGLLSQALAARRAPAIPQVESGQMLQVPVPMVLRQRPSVAVARVVGKVGAPRRRVVRVLKAK